MKKIKFSLFALFLMFAIVLTSVPVLADDGLDTASFMVGDRVVSTTPIVGGSVAMAKVPGTAPGFCGWTTTVGERTIFLPAGAVCHDLPEGDVVFTAVTASFVTDPSCSIRLKDDQVALRFTSTIVTEDYEKLVAIAGGKDKVAFGTYIVPKRYVTDASGNFTLEALAKVGHTKYIDVPAWAFFSTTSTTSTIAGSVARIKRGNYTLDYTGIGYMKITYSNGAEGTVYASYNQKQNSFNILRTVLKAYNDRDESYGNLVVEATGSTHSPYTLTELGIMQKFLDRVVLVGHDADYNYFVLKTAYYNSPWQITFSSDEYERNKIFAQPPAGMTAEDAQGIYIDGLPISLKRSKVENGKLVFSHDSYVTVE